MFRKTTWRTTASDAVSLHQDQALNTTIFLLKSFGPTGFLLKEEGEAKNFKVCLGNPHTCTCPVFIKEQEPCKHICWLLLRKFRIPQEHEYSFQPGLVERQILEILHGLHQTKTHRMQNDPPPTSGTPSQAITGPDPGSVRRKVIQAQDVCPICQEELLEKKQPVCYCRFGCGNNVHISCMKVWADHQKLSDREETVKCPLCREEFSSLKLLQGQVKNAARLFTAAEREKAERHLGVVCHSCRISPVSGTCYKCTVCRYLYLCEACVKTGSHQQHVLASRTRKEKWRIREDSVRDETGTQSKAVNKRISSVADDPLPENVLASLPSVRVRPGSQLLDVGLQCRICLQDFSLGQCVRTLPCHHKFHSDCVDQILLKSNCCPLDGFVLYNPLAPRSSERKTPSKVVAKGAEQNLEDLFVPGVALRHLNPSSQGCPTAEELTGCAVTFNTSKQRKQSPEISSSVIKSKTKQKLSSPHKCCAVTNSREQAELDLSVGLSKPETADCPVRLTRLQPKTTSTANREMSVLRITGVNTGQQRKT
ncbi:E3 ubiquitin-protein ligase ZSWIM2 isoform X2 [Halichoeres trimaculatus]|uniref:E3 ubiquitin-protein ligase ZSWIM2 isoform X2 n=1 Tax=Halichoeres trimaculatus TaxID=147232 RepID=UPI003D9E9708